MEASTKASKLSVIIAKCLEYLDSAYAYVTLPRYVQIENRRLGVLLRTLQVVVFVVVLWQSAISKVYLVKSTPHHMGVLMWTDFPDGWPSNESLQARHCKNFSQYVYTFDATRTYSPEGCKRIPAGEATTENGCGDVFFATYIEDYLTNGTQTSKQQFFVQGAEKALLYLNHGYEVELEAGRTQRGLQQGQAKVTSDWARADFSVSLFRTGVEETLIEGEEGQLLTIIRSSSGDECAVNGRSRWGPGNGDGETIHGSLEEWLACAGLVLDNVVPELSSASAQQVGFPRLRLTGLRLLFDMEYLSPKKHSEAFRGVVCYLKVNSEKVWNLEKVVAYSQLPRDDFQGIYRWRHQYGATVYLRARGTFATFSFLQLTNLIVNIVVLLGLPVVIVNFIAVYLLGPLSDVYYRFQNQQLNILEEVNGLSARMISGLFLFKGIAKEEGGEAFIEEDHMAQLMQEVFRHVKELDEGEIRQLTNVVMRGIDLDKKGDIDLDEFIRAFSSSEGVGPHVIAKIFDSDRKVGCLERIFTDSKMKSQMKFQEIVRERSTPERSTPATPSQDPPPTDGIALEIINSADPQVLPKRCDSSDDDMSKRLLDRVDANCFSINSKDVSSTYSECSSSASPIGGGNQVETEAGDDSVKNRTSVSVGEAKPVDRTKSKKKDTGSLKRRSASRP